jgi:hypothetical protein
MDYTTYLRDYFCPGCNKCFRKMWEEENLYLFQLSLWGQHCCHNESRRRHKKRKLQTNTHHKHKWKNINRILANRIPEHIKRVIQSEKVGLVQGMQGWLNIWKAIIVILHLNRLIFNTAFQSNSIMSLDTENALDKNSQQTKDGEGQFFWEHREPIEDT